MYGLIYRIYFILKRKQKKKKVITDTIKEQIKKLKEDYENK